MARMTSIDALETKIEKAQQQVSKAKKQYEEYRQNLRKKIFDAVIDNIAKDKETTLMEYQGMSTCAAAKQLYGGGNVCGHGCIGLGDCERVCPYGAIKVC